MTKKNMKKPKREYLKKEPEVFFYYDAKGAKLWGYRHRYYDALGDRREKGKQGLVSENIALRGLLQVKADLANGNIKRVDNSNLTVSAWLDVWFETHKNDWKVTSRSQRKNAIKYQMKPLLGKYKLADLDKSTYKRVFINVLLKKYKPSSVQLFHRLFKVAINAAVDNEIIQRNRFNNITIEDNKVEDNFMTADSLKLFLFSAKTLENITNYTAILLLSYTGLRKGELQGLKWVNINFETKELTVERTRDKYGERTPKTKKSYRTIIIDDIVLEQLKIYKTWCKKILLTYGKKLKVSGDDYIFISHQSGTPIGDNTLNACFARIAKETGTTRITPHGLRHTHATILIGQKTPLKTIADRLGNTPEMVLKVYGHSFKELEIESVIAFSHAMNQAMNS